MDIIPADTSWVLRVKNDLVGDNRIGRVGGVDKGGGIVAASTNVGRQEIQAVLEEKDSK